MSKFFPRCVSLVLAVLLVAGPTCAAENGQDDLNKATEAKMAPARTVEELGEVIRLLDSAIKKGLDAPNTEYANRLLAATLVQRAQEASNRIVADSTDLADFRRRREALVADLQRAIKLDATLGQAHLLLAQLNLLPGGAGVKEARAPLDKAIELSANDNPTRSKALVLRAAMQEKPDKRLADLDEAVRLMPNSAAPLRARSRALAEMNKPEMALADLNKALELESEDDAILLAKVSVLAQLKKYDEALTVIDALRHRNPEATGLLVERAKIHAQQQKIDAALADLNQALKADPQNVMALLIRAAIYQEKGDTSKSMADADAALKAAPNLPAVLRAHASLLAQNDRLDQAAAELEKLAKLDPKDTVTLLQLGTVYSAKKQSAKAIETFRALLLLEPDAWQAHRGLGDALLNLGRHAEAIVEYEKAFRLEPKDDGILNNLAWVLATSPDAKLRNGRRAIELATLACKLTDYKAAHILSTLAAAYAETGDFPSALKWSTKAVKLGGKNKEELDALKKELENYKAKKPTRELLSEEKPEKKG
jgi:tetratricopeptide (TPR) repeat protein